MTFSRPLVASLVLWLLFSSCGDENVDLITDNRDFISPNEIQTDTLFLEVGENFRYDFVNTRGALLGRATLADGREFRATPVLRFVPVSDTGLIRALSARLRLRFFVDERAKFSTKTVSFQLRRVENPPRWDSTQWRADSVFSRTSFHFAEALSPVITMRVSDTSERVVDLPFAYAQRVIESAKRGSAFLRDTAATTIALVLTAGDSIANVSLTRTQLELAYDKRTPTTIERVSRFFDVLESVYAVQTTPDALPNDALYLASSTGDWARLKFPRLSLSPRTQLVSAQLLLVRDTLFSFAPDTTRATIDQENQLVVAVDTLQTSVGGAYRPVSFGYVNEREIHRYRANLTETYQRAISRGDDIALLLRPLLLQGSTVSFRVFGKNDPNPARRPRLIVSYFKPRAR
ncbi:MAG: hypothetical protein NZM06_02465 [Chloroherpetonaceae bacterium]|nr:hypothetical protein [Chloroherpetonaceae bacterium]MDW8436509.1 hypothetical protein [Chloroherpetonaceae bacterium]